MKWESCESFASCFFREKRSLTKMPIPILQNSYTHIPAPASALLSSYTWAWAVFRTTYRKLIILKAIFLLFILSLLTWFLCVCVCVCALDSCCFNSQIQNAFIQFYLIFSAMRQLNSGANRAHEFCSSCSSVFFVAVVLIQFNNILISATNHNNNNNGAHNLS